MRISKYPLINLLLALSLTLYAIGYTSILLSEYVYNLAQWLTVVIENNESGSSLVAIAMTTVTVPFVVISSAISKRC